MRKRTVAACAAIAGVAVSVAACSSGGSSNSGSAAALTSSGKSINILDITATSGVRRSSARGDGRA